MTWKQLKEFVNDLPSDCLEMQVSVIGQRIYQVACAGINENNLSEDYIPEFKINEPYLVI